MKNCLLIFAGKRSYGFDEADKINGAFNARGYCFDKMSRVAYDDSQEIVRAVRDGLDNYENLVIYCPAVMRQTVKEYISGIKGAEFDGAGQMNAQTFSAFVMCGGDSFLTPDRVCDALDKKYNLKYQRAFIKTVCAPSATVVKAIEGARAICENLCFNVREQYGDCLIEIIYPETTPKGEFDKAYRELLSGLREYVYALENVSLASRLVELLKLRRMKISVAESFTGGGVGARLVEIAGVSEVYSEGLNTYSNQAKCERLGVSNEILRAYGAVSEETAAAMAQGLLAGGECDVAISTTGIAGPASDNTAKPVGLCYIGVGTREKTSVYKYNLKGDRETVTKTAINIALFLAFKIIK